MTHDPQRDKDAISRLEQIARQSDGPEKLRRQLCDSAISQRFRTLLQDVLGRLDALADHPG